MLMIEEVLKIVSKRCKLHSQQFNKMTNKSFVFAQELNKDSDVRACMAWGRVLRMVNKQ